jgi:hypothetical protein
MVATLKSSLLLLLLMPISTLVTARAVPAVAERRVLSDLSSGFCRSWKFGGKLPSSQEFLKLRE